MSSKNIFSSKKTLFISYSSLPERIKEAIDDDRMRNDTLIPHFSEFEPVTGPETWESSLTRYNLESYYKDQVDANDFKGTLKDFIKEYNLELDVWLVEQIEAGKLSLTGIEKILIELKW